MKRRSCLHSKNSSGTDLAAFFLQKNQPDVQLTKKKRG
ncbi:hypothetical protein B4098_1445 [Heyndrickxia coagulans]|uniref:Uncharacterized protein n=1 Tax=Heyndrickxia coagulans TaxID=1398 RepID=A0A150KAE4_HEYCO|nr:hypothetical protein B4098_1445 [Heyndrickxia coagulans]